MSSGAGPLARLSDLATIHASIRAAWMRAAAGIGAVAPASPSGPLGVAGPSFLGVGPIQAGKSAGSRGPAGSAPAGSPQLVGIGAPAAGTAGKRQIRFLRPRGVLTVNSDWRNLAAGLGSGTHTTRDGYGLWLKTADLWLKGTTKTWVGFRGASGLGKGYAAVKYEGKAIAVVPWDRETIVTVPSGASPVVQIDGVVNDGVWVWSGEDVWYHFYKSNVIATSCTVPLAPVPPAGKVFEVQPLVSVRLGNVSWALSAASRKIIGTLYGIMGESAYGQIIDYIMNAFSGLDPDRGLGQIANQEYSKLVWDK